VLAPLNKLSCVSFLEQIVTC